ncbi:MAG TPA: VOC family protein [Solirubrobacteraceae bacterium]
MGARTSHPPGTFSWVELGTSDSDGAKAFYGALLGWEYEDLPIPDSPPYTMAKVGGKRVGALYQAQQGPPNWLSYVTVADVDATAARAGELGATLISEPFDVMDAGRMAVVQDPTGAVFALWQAGQSIGAELVNDPGSLTMNQLNTGDTDAAARFYEALFGWRFARIPESPEPFWSINNGDRLNGAMMPAPEGVPAHWLAYFTTADLDGAVTQIGAGGGTVVIGPVPIPAGRFAVATDPQGAAFALFEGDVDD